MTSSERCDYLIVGAGTAGCVLANRLSEDPSVRVVVIEAGPPDRDRAIAIPAGFPSLTRSAVDWGDWTEPQPGLGGGKVFQPRGKTLGGSSSLNAQVYQRGHPADFDEWAAAGCAGWSHGELVPFFERVERRAGHPDMASGQGPLDVNELRDPNPLTKAFVASGAALGLTQRSDFSREIAEGIGLAQVTQRRGRRWSSADAYLRPALRRPNLRLLTGAQATRIRFEGRRAVGVELVDEGVEKFVRCERELLLAGGAFNSPHLLQLSGVGAPDELRAAGIEPLHELPGVGRNLHDHPLVGLRLAIRRPISLFAATSPGSLLRYLLLRRGHLTSNVCEAMAFVKSAPELPAPDVEIVVAPVFYDILNAATLHAVSIGPAALRPRSVGAVTLRSADPMERPRIDPGYLTDPEGADLAALVHGVHWALRIAATEPLASEIAGRLVPEGPLESDQELRAFVRTRLETIYHPAGSCRMGIDALAVVDPELRVRGLDGLRVVDASIMPRLVRAHPQAAVYAIAEKGAAMIRSFG